MHGLDVIRRMNDRAVEKERESDVKCRCGKNTLDTEDEEQIERAARIIWVLCRKKAA